MHDLDVRMLSNYLFNKYAICCMNTGWVILFEPEHECQLEQSRSWADGKQPTDTFLSELLMKWFGIGPK